METQNVSLVVKLYDDADRGDIYGAIEKAGIKTMTTRRRGETGPSGPEKQLADPITAILIAGGAIALAKFVTDWFEKRRGGLVIDLRAGAEPELRRDPDVPFGYIVVLPGDGTVKIDVQDAPKDAMERLLTQIIDKTYGTAKSIAEAAAKTIGAERVSAPKP